MAISKLDDPNNLAGEKLFELSKKVEYALAVLAHKQSNGGNPLLFAISAGKRHVLADIPTAATDAVKYYWGAKFLEKLTPSQVLAVLKHESLHILLMHCEQLKGAAYPKAFNLAADFIVNSIIEREWRLNEKNPSISLSHVFKKGDHPLWKGELGNTYSFEELKELFNNDKEVIIKKLKGIIEPDSCKNTNKQDNTSPSCDEKAEKTTPAAMILVDLSLLNRPSYEIYKEIKEWFDSLSQELQDLLTEFTLDNHIPGERNKEESIKDLLKAFGMAKQLRGTIPSEIEELLKELHDPTLNLSEFLDQSIKRASIEGGLKANWTRYRKRFLSQELFLPKYMKSNPTGFVLLDTSGSMSEKDISDAVSEITQFAGAANLYIVPVDATPHWNAVTKVTKTSEFKRIKIVGRGGTVFEEFFRDYKFKMRKYGQPDFLIILTDGGCDYIDPIYTPNCRVGWVITQNIKDFKQPFGKVLKLTTPE